MELYEGTFNSIMDFNDFVNIKLINNEESIIPISVVPIKDKYKIFYTIEYPNQ